MAIKISLLPAALSIMKTDACRSKKTFYFKVTYSFLLVPVWTHSICSTVPAAKYLARGLHLDDHCSAKKITKLFNGTNYWEQETVEKKNKNQTLDNIETQPASTNSIASNLSSQCCQLYPPQPPRLTTTFILRYASSMQDETHTDSSRQQCFARN